MSRRSAQSVTERAAATAEHPAALAVVVRDLVKLAAAFAVLLAIGLRGFHRRAVD